MKYLIEFLFALLIWFRIVSCDDLEVQIGTKEYVNLVSDKFLSFTIDPKYLLATNTAPASKECLCMISSLSPAFIRIAGPSTSYLDFNNKALKMNLDAMPQSMKEHLEKVTSKVSAEILNNERQNGRRKKNKNGDDFNLSNKDPTIVDFDSWTRFASWAEVMNFTLVFGLNEDEAMDSGMWDPNTALNILSVAEKAGIGEMVWQLGYECNNQTLEEYMNDLETLRLMVKASKPGSKGIWKTTPGDVSKCLGSDSRTTFKDYVAYVDEKMDYVFLNGNATANELECIRKEDRDQIMNIFSSSPTPLWITESTMNDEYNELERAVDWMNSLGFSARNGFTTHFREIREDEMFEPTLSFYMSLLFKNLVGNRVLDVQFGESDMSVSDKASMFAHCTSLKKTPVAGAVTIFGTNMDDAATKFSIKMNKKENGGDIMQFILNLDKQGNVLVNGRPMVYRGDIRPVLKRVRPYRTLIVTLPPNSFGFWVVANTNIEACQDTADSNVDLLEVMPMKDFVVEGEKVSRRHKREVETEEERRYGKATLLDLESFGAEMKRMNTIFTSIEKILEDNESYLNEKGYKRSKREKRQATLKELVEKFMLNKRTTPRTLLKREFEMFKPTPSLFPKPQVPAKLQRQLDIIKTKPVAILKNSKTGTVGVIDQLKKDSKQIVTNMERRTKNILGQFKQDIGSLVTTENSLKKYLTPYKVQSVDLKSMINGALANLKANSPHRILKREINDDTIERINSNNDDYIDIIDKYDDKDELDPLEVMKKRERRATRTYYESDENEVESNENDIMDYPMRHNDVTKKPFPRLKKLISTFGNQLSNIEIPSKVFRSLQKEPKRRSNELVKPNNEDYDSDAIIDKLSVESKITDEDATLSFKENSNQNGVFRIALENFTRMMSGIRGKGLKLLKLLPLLH